MARARALKARRFHLKCRFRELPLGFALSKVFPSIFQPEKHLWMQCFGFVSGHDFSRAIKK